MTPCPICMLTMREHSFSENGVLLVEVYECPDAHYRVERSYGSLSFEVGTMHFQCNESDGQEVEIETRRKVAQAVYKLQSDYLREE